MTGKDLIQYILENNLEDKPVVDNGKILGFMNTVEAAIHFKVGLWTVRVWVDTGVLEGIRIGDEVYIPMNAKNPIRGGNNNG